MGKGKLPILIWFLYLLVCYQFFIWQSHAPRVTWLQMKSLFQQATRSEQYELGAICNALEDLNCARRQFESILNQDPSQGLALANLGITLARQGECETAMSTLKRYRQMGGASQDAFLWMANCQKEVGKSESALSSYYQSVAMNPQNIEAGHSLVKYLFELERFEEGLAVVGSLTEGHPEKIPVWRTRYAALLEDLRSRTLTNNSVEKRAIRIPSFDGQKFLIPVRFSPDHSFEFFEIDQNSPNVVINEDDLMQVPFRLSEKVRNPAAVEEPKIMNLPHIQVGPWIKENVEFNVCRDQCISTLGQSLLTEFSVYEQIEGSVRFLVLRPQ